MKIHIFGASGSGTTTLAKALGEHLGWLALDADEYYWKLTDPPYQEKYPLEERSQNMQRAVEEAAQVIVSGSMVSWGDYWNNVFDLAVFLYIPKGLRMERLRAREEERYGDRLKTDADIQATSKEFLEWAEQYDEGDVEMRSLAIHEAWMKRLACPVLRLEGDLTVAERVAKVVEAINKL